MPIWRAGTETSPYENTTVGEALRGFPFHDFTPFNLRIGIRHDLENSACSLVVPAYDRPPGEYSFWAFNLIFDTVKPDGTFYPQDDVREIIGGKAIELVKPAIINAQGELVEKGIVFLRPKK